MSEMHAGDLRPGMTFNRPGHPGERLKVHRVELIHLAARDPRDPDDTHATVYQVHCVGGGSVRVTSDDVLVVHTSG